MARWIPLLLVCSGCSPLIYAVAGGVDDVDSLTLGTPAHGTTASAHDDYDPRCSGDHEAADMAYTLDVPESGRYAIRARATYDVVLAVYEGETLVGCNDDHDEASVARLVVALETGRQYTVVVDGWGGAEGQRNEQTATARHRTRRQSHAMEARSLPLLHSLEQRLRCRHEWGLLRGLFVEA